MVLKALAMSNVRQAIGRGGAGGEVERKGSTGSVRGGESRREETAGEGGET